MYGVWLIRLELQEEYTGEEAEKSSMSLPLLGIPSAIFGKEDKSNSHALNLMASSSPEC